MVRNVQSLIAILVAAALFAPCTSQAFVRVTVKWPRGEEFIHLFDAPKDVPSIFERLGDGNLQDSEGRPIPRNEAPLRPGQYYLVKGAVRDNLVTDEDDDRPWVLWEYDPKSTIALVHKISGSFESNYNIHINRTVLSWQPRVYAHRAVLTKEEALHIKNMAKMYIVRRNSADMPPTRVGGNYVAKNVRDSTGFFWARQMGPFDRVFSKLVRRVSAISMIPPEYFELLNVQRYEGGHYNCHHDNVASRVFTSLIYLSDVEEGGETIFVNPNQVPLMENLVNYEWAEYPDHYYLKEYENLSEASFKGLTELCNNTNLQRMAHAGPPQAGTIVMFPLHHPTPPGSKPRQEKRAKHCSCPVRSGEKWTGQFWIHGSKQSTIFDYFLLLDFPRIIPRVPAPGSTNLGYDRKHLIMMPMGSMRPKDENGAYEMPTEFEKGRVMLQAPNPLHYISETGQFTIFFKFSVNDPSFGKEPLPLMDIGPRLILGVDPNKRFVVACRNGDGDMVKSDIRIHSAQAKIVGSGFFVRVAFVAIMENNGDWAVFGYLNGFMVFEGTLHPDCIPDRDYWKSAYVVTYHNYGEMAALRVLGYAADPHGVMQFSNEAAELILPQVLLSNKVLLLQKLADIEKSALQPERNDGKAVVPRGDEFGFLGMKDLNRILKSAQKIGLDVVSNDDITQLMADEFQRMQKSTDQSFLENFEIFYPYDLLDHLVGL